MGDCLRWNQPPRSTQLFIFPAKMSRLDAKRGVSLLHHLKKKKKKKIPHRQLAPLRGSFEPARAKPTRWFYLPAGSHSLQY